MIPGDRRFGLAEVLALAAPAGTAVVSVEYRLAPDMPHPGPVEDCYADLAWTSAHAHESTLTPAESSSEARAPVVVSRRE